MQRAKNLVHRRGFTFLDNRITGNIDVWFKIKKRDIAEYYEKENGKLVKKGLINFNPLSGKILAKYFYSKAFVERKIVSMTLESRRDKKGRDLMRNLSRFYSVAIVGTASTSTEKDKKAKVEV